MTEGPAKPARYSNVGYFAPEGAAWRVGRELALLLGGGRALLLQVAHPLVAAGVAEHSDFRRDPWKRLEGTMSAVWSIVFGSRAQADRAAARVRKMHARVQGRTSAGTPYSALDPELLMWVHATLVDTALLVHGQWVRPLGPGEQAAYYEEMKVAARLFGTPDDVIPPGLGDFRAYMDRMLEDPAISAGDTARAIAAAVMHPPLPLPLRPAMELANLITAGLMPPRLRQEYDLAWDPARAMLVRASRETTRRVLMPLLPQRLRTVPQGYRSRS
jgi:uncharacterized protein (DUF2236 family)